MRKGFLAGVLGVSIIGLGVAWAQNGAPGVAPATSAQTGTRVGVVDLATLINGLDERTDRNKDVATKAQAYVDELKKLEEEMKVLQTRLEHEVQPGDLKARIEVRTQLIEKNSLREARKKSYEALIDLQNGEIIHALYSKVLAAAEAFARVEGYDLLILDDRGIALDPQGGWDRVNATIQNKRVIFAADGLNVTARLLTKMNNDYKASGGKPTPPAVSPGVQTTPPAPRTDTKGKK